MECSLANNLEILLQECILTGESPLSGLMEMCMSINVFTSGSKQNRSDHLGNYYNAMDDGNSVGCEMKGCTPSGGHMEHDTAGQNMTDFFYIQPFIHWMVYRHEPLFQAAHLLFSYH